MIINNLEEFEQYVNSLFSCNYLSEKDKEKMKEAIDLAMESIPETDKRLKFICEYELERNSSSSVDDEKIIFCLKRLSQEKNKEIILKFIEKNSYIGQDGAKLLIKMLDCLLAEEEKIKISSKLSCKNLFKMMDYMNWFVKQKKFFQKKYYKNYYNIFNKALEYKSLR